MMHNTGPYFDGEEELSRFCFWSTPTYRNLGRASWRIERLAHVSRSLLGLDVVMESHCVFQAFFVSIQIHIRRTLCPFLSSCHAHDPRI